MPGPMSTRWGRSGPDRARRACGGTAEGARAFRHVTLRGAGAGGGRGRRCPGRCLRAGTDPVLIGLDVLAAGRPKAPAHFAMSPYAAPEQAAGAAVDARADVYALGQMIAEIWGGNIPARGGLGKLWHKDTQDEMPRAIGDIVLGMLEAEPARRTGDLKYVAEALRSQAQQMAQA